MKRLLVLGTAAVILGGCALPVPVQIASWALDGLSYLMTEKTIADHGISVLVQKDCAVLRGLLDDRDFCHDYDDTAIMVAGFMLIDDGDDGADRDQLGAPTDNQATVDFDAATNARPIIDDGVQLTAVLT